MLLLIIMLINAFKAAWRTPCQENVIIHDEITPDEINFYRGREQNIYDRLVCNP